MIDQQMNQSPDKPLGQLFSHTYRNRGEPTQDSGKFRLRLGAYLNSNKNVFDRSIVSIEIEVGVRIDSGKIPVGWRSFATATRISDLLDCLTVIYRGKPTREMIRFSSSAEELSSFYDKYVEFINRLFDEENLSYVMDELGGVHYRIDEDFDRQRISIVSGLSGSKYSSAKSAVEDAFEAITRSTPDTLTAVRRVFDAVENVFKIMFGQSRIGVTEIGRCLKPALGRVFENQEANAAKLQADAMGAWVSALHQYRHAPNTPDSDPPSLDLAVSLLSSGVSYLRWLCALDAKGLNLNAT